MGRILQVLLCAGRAERTYRLAVLFKKNGSQPGSRSLTDTIRIPMMGNGCMRLRPATDMPALRMITLENQKCNTFLAYPVPDNDWFNIVYTLSNKSRKAMKGTVKVVPGRGSSNWNPTPTDRVIKRRTRLMTMNGAMNWEAALLT